MHPVFYIFVRWRSLRGWGSLISHKQINDVRPGSAREQSSIMFAQGTVSKWPGGLVVERTQASKSMLHCTTQLLTPATCQPGTENCGRELQRAVIRARATVGTASRPKAHCKAIRPLCNSLIQVFNKPDLRPDPSAVSKRVTPSESSLRSEIDVIYIPSRGKKAQARGRTDMCPVLLQERSSLLDTLVLNVCFLGLLSPRLRQGRYNTYGFRQ